MSKFYFSDREKAAIAKLAMGMSNADGVVLKEEVLVGKMRLWQVFDITDSDINAANFLDAESAVEIVRLMPQHIKKFVSAILVVIMISDAEINSNEMEYLKGLSLLTGIPILQPY